MTSVERHELLNRARKESSNIQPFFRAISNGSEWNLCRIFVFSSFRCKNPLATHAYIAICGTIKNLRLSLFRVHFQKKKKKNVYGHMIPLISFFPVGLYECTFPKSAEDAREKYENSWWAQWRRFMLRVSGLWGISNLSKSTSYCCED